MYLHRALNKIAQKHGETTEAHVKLYTPLWNGIAATGDSDCRLDWLTDQLYRDWYKAFCLTDRKTPSDMKNFRISEPMRSPSGLCVMYRIYHDTADGLHQVALVTVLTEIEYPDYKWRSRQMRADTKHTHGRPWWLWKDL